MRLACVVGVVLLFGCASEAVISEGVDESLSSGSQGLSANAVLDWSQFPDFRQCLAAAQLFYPAKFGTRVPQARNSWTGDCAPDGACHIWLDDIPSSAAWARIPQGSGARPSAWDLVIYPPSGTNPWGHVAVVDHVDAEGNVFVMDANYRGDERKAARPHTLPRAPYGWYHLRSLPSGSGAAASLDFDGDGCDDLWAKSSSGALALYTGDCAYGFRHENLPVGSGWGSLDAVLPTPDFDGDGCADVIARNANDGNLLLYPGTCGGSLYEGRVIGTQWQTLSALTAPGDFDGDGCADVIARAGDGRLLLFPGNCHGGFASEAVQIGAGWNGLDMVIAAGDLDGDGCGDLLARSRADGRLLKFSTDCHAHLQEAVEVGTSWGAFDALAGRDWNRDGCADVLARSPSGLLQLYPGNCGGGLKDGRVIGYGFQAFTALY